MAVAKELYPSEVIREKYAGFCAGVALAVDKAYALLAEWPQRSMSDAGSAALCMLGEVIHNEHVINDLVGKGMILCNSTEEVPLNSTVLIRAHGVAPEIYTALEEKSCVVVDSSCIYVKKIHRLVRQHAAEGKTVIICGNKEHPEVCGIQGWAGGAAITVSTLAEAEKIDLPPGDYALVAQTTFPVALFNEICEQLQKKIANLQIFVTICVATENRQRSVLELARNVDIMLVIGSQGSSNSRSLLRVCSSVCGESYFVETPDKVASLLSQGTLAAKKVGVTAGASSPESIIMEVIHIMSENDVLTEQNEQMEKGDISFTDAIDSIPQLKRGATVKGSLVRYDNEYVYVDVRDKSEGRIPINEFTNNPDFNLDEACANQDEVDVFVRSIRNTDMGKEILLSKAKVDFGKFKTVVEDAFKNKTPLVVKVVNVVRDGVIATYGGVDIYIHRTQLDIAPVKDLEPYRDQEIEVMITQFDPERRRLRVSGSRRALLSKDRKAKAQELWGSIAIGDVYEGVVRSLTDFGAFIDIGGVDGLVHISELSWSRIKHPSEVVNVGDVVQVYIKDFDPATKRIKLGYKRIEDDPYHNIEERFPVGSIVHGRIMRMLNYGVFVEIAEGVDAFCHISQISSTRLNKPEDVLAEGMEVDARVVEVRNGEHRIGISIKEVAPIDVRVDGTALVAAPAAAEDKFANEDRLPSSYTDSNQGSTLGDQLDATASEVVEQLSEEV